MPLKEDVFEYPLDGQLRHFLRVCRRFGKNGVEDFVVIYFFVEGDERVPLVTFDLAHGFAHRDLRFLPLGDKRRKRGLPQKPLKELLEFAIADIHMNWMNYFRKYAELKKVVLK